MKEHLFTQSIIKANETKSVDTKNTRVSVMSRHTKEDGVTPDDRIREGVSFDEWRVEFAPPATLVGAYYRNEISWEEFERSYVNFLQSTEIKPQVEDFAKRCAAETITLMCVEDTADKCHRRLLPEELQKYQPQLKIIHK